MAKRILILGASGFIGGYLLNYLSDQGHVVIGTYHLHPKVGLDRLNLLDLDELCSFIAVANPEIVIFLSGSKDVGRCEIEPNYAISQNIIILQNYLAACEKLRNKPATLYFSTDYVFDGQEGYYRSNDVTSAKTVYGQTKLLAEKLLLAANLPVRILRVSAVMGRHAGFFRWLEENVDGGKSINLFNNTYFSPTSIGLLCTYIAGLVQEDIEDVSIIHLNDGYRLSRFEFGQLVAKAMHKPLDIIHPEQADFNKQGFQPDLSMLPEGLVEFKDIRHWKVLENIH